MGEASDSPAQPTAGTFVAKLMQSKVAVGFISVAPMPLFLMRPILTRDNARENRKDSWQRLRGRNEAARYRAVRMVTERYAHDGFVLDVGCSQGILQEGLKYRRYLGVDNSERSIVLASTKSDPRTQFVWADGSEFIADQPPDAVVMNEVIYYLPDPIGAVKHYARQLAPGGVLIISIYALTWSSRRLLRAIAARHELVESNLVRSGHLAWTVAVYRPLIDQWVSDGSITRRSRLTAGSARPAPAAWPASHRDPARTPDGRVADAADPSTGPGIPQDHEAAPRRH
jgi:2-polyprenyl-3-methyl-5-hydroxy-6-metoxy-1,4-benzoquinol methylase